MKCNIKGGGNMTYVKALVGTTEKNKQKLRNILEKLHEIEEATGDDYIIIKGENMKKNYRWFTMTVHVARTEYVITALKKGLGKDFSYVQAY